MMPLAQDHMAGSGRAGTANPGIGLPQLRPREGNTLLHVEIESLIITIRFLLTANT